MTTTYPLIQTNFWFRAGENPEDSLRRMLESLGVRVIHISVIPLSLSGGNRMQVYLDPLDKDTSDIRFSLEAHAGFVNVPTTIFIGDPNPPPPPIKDWLYIVVVLKNVFVRDRQGDLLPEPNRMIVTGTQLKIYQELPVIGPNAQGVTYTHRGVLERETGANIWMDSSVVGRV